MMDYKFEQATESLSRAVRDGVEDLSVFVGVGSRPSPHLAHLEGALSGGTRPHDLHEVEVKSRWLPVAWSCQYLEQR